MIGIATTRNRTIHAGALDARSTRATRPTRSAWTRRRDQTGHACLDEENAKFDDPHARRPDRQRPVAGRSLPRADRCCRTAASSSRGPTAPSTISPSSRSRRRTSASTSTTRRRRRTSSSTTTATTWELNALAGRRRAPSRRSSATSSARTQDPTHAGAHRLGRRHARRASTRRVKGGKFGDRRAARRRAQGRREGPHHRGLLERSAPRASRCSASRWTKAPRSSARRRSTPTAAGSPNVPPYIPVHLQPIDKFGMAIRNQRLWIQGMPGEDRRCVGCHEQRTGHRRAAPRPEPDASPSRRRPGDVHRADRRPHASIPWDARTSRRGAMRSSTILDAKCVELPHRRRRTAAGRRRSTRSGTTDPVTARRADRSHATRSRTSTSRRPPITVVYDRKVDDLPGVVRLALLPGDDARWAMGNAKLDRRRFRRMWAIPATRASRRSSRSST